MPSGWNAILAMIIITTVFSYPRCLDGPVHTGKNVATKVTPEKEDQ